MFFPIPHCRTPRRHWLLSQQPILSFCRSLRLYTKFSFDSFLFNTTIEMDLAKMTNEKKLELCKWYFRIGFAMLPFLWAVNTIWFIKEAFVVPHYEEQKQIRRYVIFSGIGTIFWTAALVAWVVTFQTQRAAWGELADSITYVFPKGMA